MNPRPPALDRLERAAAPFVGALLLVALAATALDLVHARSQVAPDLLVFRTAGERWLHGEPLYRRSDAGWEYKYAPGVAIFFAPLAYLPPRAAWAVIALLSAAALARFLQWSAAPVEGSRRLVSQILLLALVNPFSTHLFGMGQIDAILLWLMAESEAASERRPLASGLLWGLVCAVKPAFLVFGALALARRNLARVAGGAAAGVTIFAIGTLRYGAAGHAAQLAGWRDILAATAAPQLCGSQNQSAFAIACTYLAAPGSAGFPFMVAAVVLLLAVPAAIALHRARREAAASWIATAACFYATALLSPAGWRTSLLGAAPMLALLCSQARRGPAIARAVAAVTIASVLAGEQLLRRWLGNEVFLERRGFGILMLAAALAALLGAAVRAGRGRRGDRGVALARVVARPGT